MSRFTDWVVEKLNPAQTRIAQEAGTQIGSEAKITYKQAFQKVCLLMQLLHLITT